jgi:hypothetical protein
MHIKKYVHFERSYTHNQFKIYIPSDLIEGKEDVSFFDPLVDFNTYLGRGPGEMSPLGDTDIDLNNDDILFRLLKCPDTLSKSYSPYICCS